MQFGAVITATVLGAGTGGGADTSVPRRWIERAAAGALLWTGNMSDGPPPK